MAACGRQQRPINHPELGPCDLPAQNLELMAEYQQLDVFHMQAATTTKQRAEQSAQGEERKEKAMPPILPSPEPPKDDTSFGALQARAQDARLVRTRVGRSPRVAGTALATDQRTTSFSGAAPWEDHTRSRRRLGSVGSQAPAPERSRDVTSQGGIRFSAARSRRTTSSRPNLAARELRGLSLADALDVTALMALRDCARSRQLAARWLQRWLDELQGVTIDSPAFIVVASRFFGARGTRRRTPR